jgi:type VI secretion system protein ImpF
LREPGRTRGARALLFDRFFLPEGEAAAGEEPVRVLDREGLRASVRRELQRLLNTRCPVSAEAAAARPRTVLEYGLADFSHLYTRDAVARAELAAEIDRAVAAYEPRLRNARATVDDAGSERGLRVTVHAQMVVGDVVEEVAFEDLGLAGGSHGRGAP